MFLYFGAILIFIIHLIITKTAVYGDGRLYYSYLPTYLLDRTLDFTKTFEHFDITYFSSLQGPANIYPVGSAIVWAIPFLAANTVLIIFNAATGYGLLYEIFIGVWNISLVFFAIFILRKTLLKFFSESVSNLASIAIFTTTNLLFYGAVDVINSHSASFFFSSLFLYFFVQKRNLGNSLALGIIIGGLALIRSQDYLFLLFPILDFLRNKKNLMYSFITIFISFVIFIPQTILWHVYFGGWFTNPYLGVYTFDFLRPHILGVLFNSNSGMIWTPFLFVGIYGLFKYFRMRFYPAFYSIVFIFAQIYLIASWTIWWGGASFSTRMLVSSLPFFGIGIGSFLAYRISSKYHSFLILLFSAINAVLIILFLSRN